MALILNSSHAYIPEDLPNYSAIIAADGAYDRFKDKIYFSAVIGDFDSLQFTNDSIAKIHTPDQNYTDFEKALDYLYKQSITDVDVYNASGGEQDHFLGHLNAAIKYHHRLNIRFYDEQQCYFYVDEKIEFSAKIGQIISLFPFPSACVTSQGLKYEMKNYPLDLVGNIGIRNQAERQDIKITCHSGGYFLFIKELSSEGQR